MRSGFCEVQMNSECYSIDDESKCGAFIGCWKLARNCGCEASSTTSRRSLSAGTNYEIEPNGL